MEREHETEKHDDNGCETLSPPTPDSTRRQHSPFTRVASVPSLVNVANVNNRRDIFKMEKGKGDLLFIIGF